MRTGPTAPNIADTASGWQCQMSYRGWQQWRMPYEGLRLDSCSSCLTFPKVLSLVSCQDLDPLPGVASDPFARMLSVWTGPTDDVERVRRTPPPNYGRYDRGSGKDPRLSQVDHVRPNLILSMS